MTARQGRQALPIAARTAVGGITFLIYLRDRDIAIYLSWRTRDDPIYLHDRDVADYHAARRADGLWFYFGLFDRTGRNKNINSSLPFPSLFSLCPLCSLVARSKTGGEYNWWRMNGRAATHPYHCGLPIVADQRWSDLPTRQGRRDLPYTSKRVVN